MWFTCFPCTCNIMSIHTYKYWMKDRHWSVLKIHWEWVARGELNRPLDGFTCSPFTAPPNGETSRSVFNIIPLCRKGVNITFYQSTYAASYRYQPIIRWCSIAELFVNSYTQSAYSVHCTYKDIEIAMTLFKWIIYSFTQRRRRRR